MNILEFGPDKGRPVLMLHGFPGDENKQNQDLALFLENVHGRKVFLLHYTGLGDSKGSFSFTPNIT